MRARLAWPYAAGLLLLVGLPAAGGMALAFTEFSGVQDPVFTGIDNFERLASDPAFWGAVRASVVLMLIAVPLRLVAASGAALLLHRRRKGVGIARSAAYLPSVVPDAAYALLWLWLLNPLYGPLTLGLQSAGLASPEWLTDPWSARVGVALMGAFQIGEAFVIALAARRAIPSHLYDAAAVDGATPWFTLTRVTLPLMAPILALLALRDMVLTFQANFVPALLVTGGGPRYATRFLPLYVYEQGFVYFKLGYAAAMSMVMFLMTAASIFLAWRLARRWRLL